MSGQIRNTQYAIPCTSGYAITEELLYFVFRIYLVIASYTIAGDPL